MLTRLLLTFLLAMPLFAASPIRDLGTPPDPDGAYLPVDISSVANAHQLVVSPMTIVDIQRIPFILSQNAGPNHLFLKPIGWSAAEKETQRDYPGYYAKYDYIPKPDDASRAVVSVPVRDYDTAYVLAATDDDPALTTDLTLRFGLLGGSKRTFYENFTATIPRAGDATARRGRDGVVQVIPTDHGNLYLVAIPIHGTFTQDLKGHWNMQIDITRALHLAINLPDPYRYQLRPLGDPSGVRIYAMTLRCAQFQVDLEPTQPGGVFNQPQKPSFRLEARGVYHERSEYTITADVTRDDGEKWTTDFQSFKPVAYQRYSTTLDLDLSERGFYSVVFRFMRKKQVVLERSTTFAILAPDTRQHRATSPFGTWDFGGGHSSLYDDDIAIPLIVKAGLRYARPRPEAGIEDYRDVQISEKMLPFLLKQQQEDPDFKPPARGLVFHENSISGPHVLRTPDVFTGKTYKLTENDQKRFDKLKEYAYTTIESVHEHFPNTEIYFGNCMPHLLEEFCRHGIPHDYLKTAGNESGSFMRPPETQPTDFVANNAGIFMFRTILDHYGYQDTKVSQCFEMCYPCTSPGNLTPDTQASYFVRHAMHSMSWKIPLIRFGIITDCGNSYYHSNWGGAGFCYINPHLAVKPSYVAVAVMTQQLDGATFNRFVPTGSDVVYAEEFTTPAGFVTCLWTTHGTRPVTLTLPAGVSPVLTGIYGRETPLTMAGGKTSVTIGTAPVYVSATKPIQAIELGQPAYSPPPPGDAFVINKLDTLAGWSVQTDRDYELETYNFMNRRRPGDFTWTELPELAGRQHVIQITPRMPCPGSEYLQMYSAARLDKPVEIPGYPTDIGLWVYGNATWGRVVFELEDASGQRWISLGSEQGGEPNPWMGDWMPKDQFDKLKSSGKAGISDWNSDDAWGRSTLNHDGWRYVSFPLPGQYGANHDIYHWPYTSQWRFSGDSKVKYPLKFTRLAVTLPEKILYANDWRAVPKLQIAISGLQVTYADPETVSERDN